MGLTIHYQGQLQSETAYAAFIKFVEEYAEAHAWPAHPIPIARRERVRMLQPEDPDAPEFEDFYDGPTQGISLLPHPDCEPLDFEFDRDLYMQNWCKTQFAGPETHAAILQLLHETEGMFEMLDVQDEAGFWDVPDTTESRKALYADFSKTRAQIDEAAAGSPGCSVAVLTPSGRIVDILAE